MIIVKSVKILRAGRKVEVIDFLYAYQREAWLVAEGFFESAGIWRHLDGRIAGLFDKHLDGEGGGTPVSVSLYDSCTVPVKRSRGSMSYILGADA